MPVVMIRLKMTALQNRSLRHLLNRRLRRLRQPHQRIHLPDLAPLQIQIRLFRHLRRALPWSGR